MDIWFRKVCSHKDIEACFGELCLSCTDLYIENFQARFANQILAIFCTSHEIVDAHI
jgi:hypothetical protein